jgi:hypothetical protein
MCICLQTQQLVPAARRFDPPILDRLQQPGWLRLLRLSRVFGPLLFASMD